MSGEAAVIQQAQTVATLPPGVWVTIVLSGFSGLGSLLSVVFFGGRLLERMKMQGDELRKLRAGLYRDDGTLIYRTSAECERKCASCQGARDETRTMLLEAIKADMEDLKHGQMEMKRAQDNQNLRLSRLNEELSKFGLARSAQRQPDRDFYSERQDAEGA